MHNQILKKNKYIKFQDLDSPKPKKNIQIFYIKKLSNVSFSMYEVCDHINIRHNVQQKKNEIQTELTPVIAVPVYAQARGSRNHGDFEIKKSPKV